MALVGTVSGSAGRSSTAVTGTLTIANVPGSTFPRIPTDAVLFVSGSIWGASKTVVGGDLVVSGGTMIAAVSEALLNSNGSTGTVAFSLLNQGVFYVNNPAGNITANFTNVPQSELRIITPTVILSQSTTPRIVSAVQIDSVGQTINWANGVTPTGTADKQDVFGFSLIRSGSSWKVLGQMSTYG